MKLKGSVSDNHLNRILHSLLLAMIVLSLNFTFHPDTALAKSYSPKKITLKLGQRYQLKIKSVKKSKAKYKSGNSRKVSVSKSGVLKAKKTGTTTVKVRYRKKTYRFKVTVLNPKLSASNASLYPNQSFTLKLKGIRKSDKVTWSSSDSSIAAVSSSGKITGKAVGSAVITAACNGWKFSCTVRIMSPPVNVGSSSTSASASAPSRSNSKSQPATASGSASAVMSGTGSSPVASTGPGYVSGSVASDEMTDEEAYRILISFKEKYPEGMPWTNDVFYRWYGNIYYGGFGCVAFAFELSDAVFGTTPAAQHTLTDPSVLRPGDILRNPLDTHSMIVLWNNGTYITIAEANFNSSVHWGRELSYTSLSYPYYVYTYMTRWQGK